MVRRNPDLFSQPTDIDQKGNDHNTDKHPAYSKKDLLYQIVHIGLLINRKNIREIAMPTAMPINTQTIYLLIET